MKIQHYDLVGEYNVSIQPMQDGDYVLFEDVEELKTENESLREALVRVLHHVELVKFPTAALEQDMTFANLVLGRKDK